jgi:cation diffusion facilitator CzcD-associated flavoprotein CzcO
VTAAPVVVIGAGPAGLATAACLKRRGVDALVLEAAPALGHSWRNHYERLHLHTAKEHSHLPGLKFDENLPRYPSRADVVAYLEQYAAHFAIAPRTGEPVRRIERRGDGFAIESAREVYDARAVVMATGANRLPNPEGLPGQDRFRGPLVHSAQFRSGAAFAGQRVLVVGAGNSGAEIALDLAEQGAHPTLAVRSPVNVVPRDFLGMPTQLTSIRMRRAPLPVADAIARTVSRLAFGNLARYGLARPAVGTLSDIARRGRVPILDVGTIAAIKRGDIAVKPAVERFEEAGAVFADGSSGAFEAVVVATGFRPALEDIVAIPGALDERGFPRAESGAGLYFVGYHQVATGLLREIGIEAEAVAAAIARERDGERPFLADSQRGNGQ